MKHLKKYNESVDKSLYNSEVSDYIKLVFADFIDDGSEFEFEEGSSSVSLAPFAECYINIDIPTLHKPNPKMDGYSTGGAYGEVSEFIENAEKVLDIYKDIETCINRIKDKYPDIRHRIEKEADEIYQDKLLSYANIHIEWGKHSEFK